MAGTRHNLFSGRLCDAMATEPNYPVLFVYFTILWQDGSLRYCISTPRLSWGAAKATEPSPPLPLPLHPSARAWGTGGWNGTRLPPCPLTRGITHLGGHLGTTLNNGTERGSLFLLRKRTIMNFIARPRAGGFPRFPKKLFLLYVSNNQTAPGVAAGAGAGTGGTHGAGDAARACVHSRVKALRSSPLEASQLCQPCLSLHQSCQLG